MPYIKEVCVAGNTIEVCKYYTARYHDKGKTRQAKEKPSTDKQKEMNQRRAEKDLRRLMNTNFKDGDYLVRLDFSRAKLPRGSEEMQTIIAGALRKLRNLMRKDGMELKYIYVKEVGKRGSRHIHMMMNKCETDLLRKVWPHGGIHIDPLFSDGQYRKIASYFIKYAGKTEETEGRLIGKRWYGSRNLEKPIIRKSVMSPSRFKEKPKIENGYYLEKDSEAAGISEYTGFLYYTYTLIRAGTG